MATRRRSRTPAAASEIRDPSRARLSSVMTDATDEDPDAPDDAAATGDDSIGSNGRRRSRPEINRRVPQSSFAYGAPSDGTTRQRTVSGSRKSVDSTRSPSVPNSPQKNRQGELEREPSAQPQPPPQQLPAAVRYQALKARNNAAANAASQPSSISTLLERGAASPARRSARFSVPPEAADAGPSSTRRSNGASHNVDVEESEEEDAYGKNRKSSVPPPSSSSMAASRSRIAGEQQLNSIFLRAPDRRGRSAHSMSPGPAAAEERERMLMTSSLLRGAQRPSHDPLSPRRGDMDSTRSSDMGDSRSYASEEAYVRGHGRDDDDDPRDVTPPARGQTEGWVGKLAQLSPWRRNGALNGNNGEADEPSGSQPGRGQKSTGDGKTPTAAKRRPRSSQDTLWRPSRDDEESDSDDDDDEGPRKKSRRRRVSDKSSARAGRDDNKIWANGRRRKGRKSQQGGAEGHDEGGMSDSSLTSIGATNDEAGEANADFAAEKQTAESSRGKEKSAGSATAPATQQHPPSIDLAKWVGLFLLGLLLLGTFTPQPKTASPIRQSSFASRLPIIGHLFGGAGSLGDFAAPDLPPSDFDSFVARLLSLETSVAAISSTSTSLLNSQDQMSRKIAALELSSKEVRSLLDKVDEAAKSAQKGLDGKIRALEAVGEKMRSQAARLEGDVASISDSVQKDRTVMEKRLQSLQANLERNEQELARVRASARQAEGIANEAKEALRPLLEANLPAQMPVRLDAKTGKAQIEPWFYDHLKQIFASAGSSGKQDAAVVPETSWEAFRAANDAALRALAAEEADRILDYRSSSRDKHAILSRSDFLEVLQAEIEAMKATLEESFNANAQEMQNDILGKVRAQQNMYEDSGSWTKGKKAPRGGSESPFSGIPDLAGLQMKDGSNPTQSILALIEAALETYSADRLNKADFALYSAGGRVIPSMTSPSYEIPSLARRSWLSWVPGVGPSKSTQHLRSRSPVVALHHDNAPGMCWPFAGQSGQLGIQLARKAIVTDITIEHPATALTFGDSSSAPREVTVSALVERAEDRRKLAEWKRQEEEERMLDGDGQGEDDGSLEMVSAPPSPNHIHLASFTYDPTSHRSIQTFPVSAEARALRIPVSILQVHVLSNNGEKAYTCLYRVRVHGEAWKDENESS